MTTRTENIDREEPILSNKHAEVFSYSKPIDEKSRQKIFKVRKNRRKEDQDALLTTSGK